MNINTVLRLSAFYLLLLPVISRAQNIFFHEGFDDANLSSRGWYDNTKVAISTVEHLPGSTGSAEYHFLQGARTGVFGGGIRRKFRDTDQVYLSYYIKYSAGWTGSNKPYHPHEFHFLTNIDSTYTGPAYTHLTLYIEENEGTPLLAIQDAHNIDESHIGEDLTNVTEARSVAGCNGDGDGYGVGDCYQSGAVHNNGKQWRAGKIYFSDAPGPTYKNDWHRVEAYFRLNTIVNGKAIADGVVQYWYDDGLIIDHHDVMLRTGEYPQMRFNQFLIAPYIGDGSPVDQTMWIDDLTVGASRPDSSSSEVKREEPGSGYRLESSPNPFSMTTTIRFTLPKQEHATLKIMNMRGEDVRTLVDAMLDAGDHSLMLDRGDLPAGVYLCRLNVSGVIETRSVIVVR